MLNGGDVAAGRFFGDSINKLDGFLDMQEDLLFFRFPCGCRGGGHGEG